MKLKALAFVAMIGLVSLLAPAPLSATPPPLSLPAKVKGQPGAFVTIAATTTGKSVKWLVLDPGLQLFPVDLLKSTTTAIVVGSTPGSYRLLAVTALGDEVSEPAICEVLIEGATPTPTPAPDPAPQPVPAPAANLFPAPATGPQKCGPNGCPEYLPSESTFRRFRR